jgi:hypothetical protein
MVAAAAREKLGFLTGGGGRRRIDRRRPAPVGLACRGGRDREFEKKTGKGRNLGDGSERLPE